VTGSQFLVFAILIPGFAGVFMMWMHMMVTVTLHPMEREGIPAMYWFFVYGFGLGLLGSLLGLVLRGYA